MGDAHVAVRGEETKALYGLELLISDPRNLESSVEEVLRLMVGTRCRRAWEAPTAELDSVTAIVGFAGILTGACVLTCGSAAACAITAGMTGQHFSAVDDMVKDAIGELCNMIAGAWKSRLPQLASRCDLSVPAVISGSDYHLRVQAPEFTLRHTYGFNDVAFAVTILCDGLHQPLAHPR